MKRRPNGLDWFVLITTGLLVVGYIYVDNAAFAAVWGILFGARIGEVLHFRMEQKRHDAEGFF